MWLVEAWAKQMGYWYTWANAQAMKHNPETTRQVTQSFVSGFFKGVLSYYDR